MRKGLANHKPRITAPRIRGKYLQYYKPLKFLVSAGPTREYFDSIRFISNPSSGKMGYALARAAARRGHEVVLVSGPVAIAPPENIKTIQVTTAEEMARACRKAFAKCDIAVLAAAVCDYRPIKRVRLKTPKHTRPWHLALEPTEDIAASLGRRKGRHLLVCFALEDHSGRQHAQEKLVAKHCDMIILNGPKNIDSDQATVELFSPDQGWYGPVKGLKSSVAGRIVLAIERMAFERGQAR